MICPIIMAGASADPGANLTDEKEWNRCREHNCALWDNDFFCCSIRATSRALLRIADQMVDQSMIVNTRV